MPTIKDIAQLAGVSQGTVSNVLNGKGIVSSEKIRMVENAAAALGYTVNERAKLLRKGKGKILAVILPNIRFRHYVDFYLSFKSHAENQGYTVLQYISNDNPETELAALAQIRSEMATGIAVFSCLKQGSTAYREAGFAEHEVLFVEREPGSPCNYIGFDYALCGKALAELAMQKGLKSLTLLSDNLSFSNEADFIAAYRETIKAAGTCTVAHIQTDLFRKNQSAIQIFTPNPPEGIFCTNHDFAQTVKDVWENFYAAVKTSIFTVSPIFSMPESDYTKYELNYRLMGQTSAKFLISNLEDKRTGRRTILENAGFRKWEGIVLADQRAAPRRLNVLTLESPAADAMRSLSRIYTQSTKVEVNVSVFSYEEIHEVLNTMDSSSIYDIVRLDVTWLSWFAHKILRPLEQIDPSVTAVLDTFVEGISRKYSFVEDTLYALPVSPSNQLFFYRKDLFESTVLKRLFHEEHKSSLEPPRNFAEYNRIARFFTKALTPQSPVDYGSTVTLGSTGVAGTEFLTRYFSYTDSLFAPDGKILLTSAPALRSLEDLVELKYCSKEHYCTWWTNAAQEFADGNVAMSILYSNFASEILGKNSKVINKIGYAAVPGNNTIIGGGTLGVSRFSKQPEPALSFIRWMCSEPISSALTLLGSVPSCKKSFDNYEVVDTYPWLELSKECFSRSHYRRTPSKKNAPFDERRFLSILGTAVKNAYSGAQTPQEALKGAQEQYEANAAALTLSAPS